MAKSKYAPALFEVINTKDEKSSGGFSLPKWWRSKSAPASPAAAGQLAQAQQPPQKPIEPALTTGPAPVPTAPSTSDASPSPLFEASQPAAASPAAATPPTVQVQTPARGHAPTAGVGLDADEDHAPVARVREGRVELSLNTTNVAIVAGVLLIGLFLAYQVGRGLSKTATPSPEAAKKTDDLDVVRNGPATPAALNIPAAADRRNTSARTGSSARPTVDSATPRTGAPTPAPPAAALANRSVQVVPPATPASSQRTAGLTYLILETLNRAHKAEAEQIQQWLKDKHNIDVTIESSGDKFQLVSTQGFDYNNATEKARFEEFRQIVKGLGKQYKTQFGSKASYSMHEPYGRKYNQR